MPARSALLVAVSAPAHPDAPPLPYVADDARDLRAALEPLGFPGKGTALLAGEEATREAVESALAGALGRLAPGDTFLLSFAGPVYRRQGRAWLAAADTRPDALEETALSLAALVASLRAASCARVLLLLDPGPCEWPPPAEGRDFRAGFAAAELEALFPATAPAARKGVGPALGAFLACGPEEGSHVSARLRHGIWAHQLARALRGEEREALEQGRHLTAASLQAHLAHAVPRAVRTLLAGTPSQTPRLLGEAGSGPLADLREVLAAREGEAAAGLESLERALLKGASSERVQRLAGWKKHFRLPESASQASVSFVRSIGAPELKARFDVLLERVRRSLGYRRGDLTVEESPGSHACITPDFSFTLSLDLDPESPARYVEALVVSEIRDPARVASPEFAQAFDGEFDEVVLEYAKPFDIGRLIDAIEALRNPRIAVEYPPDARECTVIFTSLKVRLRFAGHTLSYAFASKAAVRHILEALRNAPRVLGLDRPDPRA